MADWHALTGSEDGNQFRIVYHIPIPDVANRAAISYRVALINSDIGGRTQLPDGDGTGGTISAAEKAEIQAGALYEHVEPIDTHPGETAGQLQAKVDARFVALKAAVQGRIAKRLTYFGYTRTVPA